MVPSSGASDDACANDQEDENQIATTSQVAVIGCSFLLLVDNIIVNKIPYTTQRSQPLSLSSRFYVAKTSERRRSRQRESHTDNRDRRDEHGSLTVILHTLQVPALI